MSTIPTVSVGIPFYNSEATLLNSVRSVFAQTFQDWELVLMDDGSTDGSLEVARSIDDPRVRVISDGKNLRLPGRLNALHRVTKGRYIARMDSDDLMHPRRLEEQVALLDERPDVDVVGTLMYAMDARKGVHGVEGS
ncbi:MAG: glycosyltransferase family A protein, partial [Armatimonadia bacterium]